MTSEKSAARERLAGFATGLAFGALLQQGRLARHEVITGQLRMRDPRVARTMGTAVPVSALGVHALERAGVSTKEVKPTKPGAVLAGAGVFGVGLATLGYCPGTSIAAAGEGHRDALAGVAGMLGGAAVFVALRPKLEAALEAEGDRGPITLPSVTGTPASPWVAAIAGSALASLARARLSPRSPSASPRTTAPSPASSRSRR